MNMKKSIIKGVFTLAALALTMTSCNKFLDENPDHTYVSGNTPYLISRFLTYSYPLASIAYISELASDNTSEDIEWNPYRDRFLDEAFQWKDISQADGFADYDGTSVMWEQYYYPIAQANEVLTLIQESGDEGPRNLASRGEALAVRAWAHFQLANLFCLPYNYDGQGGATNLGIPYVKERVTTLLPDYPRGTLKETYELIEQDLLAAIPLLEKYSDYKEEIKRFHFTPEAAYAFAARFYLYYNKPEKAKEYADKVLGTNPQSRLRKWESIFANINAENANAKALAYSSLAEPANLLVVSLKSNYPSLTTSGEYFTGTRYAHQNRTADAETLWANIWNKGGAHDEYNFSPYVYNKVYTDKVYQPKMPELGSGRTKEVLLTTDELLINRAEAEVRLGDYDAALRDLNAWTEVYLRKSVAKRTFTEAELKAYYDKLPYADKTTMSPKKHITGAHFTLHDGSKITEGTRAEILLQYVLQCRRVLTLHEGLRWQDIKRYGITVYHWTKIDLGTGTYEVKKDGILEGNDLRQAILLPEQAIKGKIKQNPR